MTSCAVIPQRGSGYASEPCTRIDAQAADGVSDGVSAGARVRYRCATGRAAHWQAEGRQQLSGAAWRLERLRARLERKEMRRVRRVDD